MYVGIYHKILRVSALLVALILLFDGGFVLPITKQLSDNTIRFLANSSSVTVAVPENELNIITAQLTERERDLAIREASLNEREIAARDFGDGTSNDISVYLLSSVLFVLTLLILFNYALDIMRARKNRYAEQTV